MLSLIPRIERVSMSDFTDKLKTKAKIVGGWLKVPIGLGILILAILAIGAIAEHIGAWVENAIDSVLSQVGDAVAVMLPWLAERYHVPKEELGGGALVILGALLLVWLAPKGAVARARGVQGLSDENKLKLEMEAWKAETECRKTLLQIMAGLFAIVTVYFAYQSFRTSEDKYSTDLLAKAGEQLGSKESAARLGAVYALEGMARQSPENHRQAVEMLTAFVREKSRLAGDAAAGTRDPNRAPADVQAAMDVLGRRKVSYDPILDPSTGLAESARSRFLDFDGADLRAVTIINADFRGATFINARLEHASLWGCQLQGALFAGVNLEGANFWGSHLEGTDLSGTVPLADLSGFKNATQDDYTKLPPVAPPVIPPPS
jgi:Pentapeptide repeats (8 copies)